MSKPSITFFCELDTPGLQKLFSDNKVIKDLKSLNANISLGLLDLSPERAKIVTKLTKSGIPVTAWLLLPKEEGYWTSLDTIQQTALQYRLFKEWRDKYSLKFAAVGLDIEPKLDTVVKLGSKPLQQVPDLLNRLFLNKQFTSTEMDAQLLINTIQSDGYAVETYQFPTVVDERKAKSTLLSKTLGIPALSSDREVLMLYSSFFPAYSDSILWSYAKHASAIAVGSTGGGVELTDLTPLKVLRWIDLKRDLLLANQYVSKVYIFSLEGCLANNYMDRLINLNWDTEIVPPTRSALGISLIRQSARVFLWMTSHPFEVIGAFLASIVLFRRIKK